MGTHAPSQRGKHDLAERNLEVIKIGITPVLTKLGPFQILEVIGRGGMGTVYRGIDPMIGRPVAVKVIRLVGYYDNDKQEWLRDRLFREARAAGSLSHPSIVTIYQVGEEQDVAYIAMEFVDGPSLRVSWPPTARGTKQPSAGFCVKQVPRWTTHTDVAWYIAISSPQTSC